MVVELFKIAYIIENVFPKKWRVHVLGNLVKFLVLRGALQCAFGDYS